MTESATYYAIVSRRTTPEQPAGLARRLKSDNSLRDESLNRQLEWQRTSVIASWERAESSDDLVEVSAEEADRIIAYFRDKLSSGS